jgi:Ser/Thr protein kinase RdoA (MazF antagonist)
MQYNAESGGERKPMKPYEDLTHSGRSRRLRRLAGEALRAYGLAGANFRLERDAGDTLFRVTAPEHDIGTAAGWTAGDLYEERQYLLRIHHPTCRSTDTIGLELAWLLAMCRDAGLSVPEPVPTPDGRLLIQISTPGIPGERNCSLLRWLKGRFVKRGVGPRHFRAQGRLMGGLHAFAASWQAPAGLVGRHYDWNGLFQNDAGSSFPAREAWPLIPEASAKPFRIVARKVQRIMEAWGRGPDVYGLIHADLGIDANVLFRGGEARAIDFGECGYGYWVYDLAISLEHCREDAAFPRFRGALLEGYGEIRWLPEEHLRHLDLFAAAFYIYWSLWATGMIKRHPCYRREFKRRLERYARYVKAYLAGS